MSQPAKGTGRDDMPEIHGGIVQTRGHGHTPDVTEDGIGVVGGGEDKTTTFYVGFNGRPRTDFRR